MIDTIYQDQTDQVLRDRIDRPLPPPASPGRGFWTAVGKTAAAPVVGVAAGATESAGFSADQLGAFGQITAGYATQADPARLFDPLTKPEQEQSAEARAAVQSGEAFSTQAGTSLRASARDMAPDPNTANAAERLLFGFAKFGTKALAYTALGGPIPGAVLTGTDEATAEADRLKAEGVDATTRMKVAGVQGIGAGLGVVMPFAGKTVAQTAGLIAAGGPGAYIAQQAASRAMLKDAGYSQISDQYDPYDPVALTVATLVPAGFGALHMRSAGKVPATPAAADMANARALLDMGGNERKALKYDDPRLDAYAAQAAAREGVPADLLIALKNAGEKSNPSAVSPVGARGVAQLMPDNVSKYGVKDPHDPVQSIDGMAKYVRDTMKQYNGDIRAVIADYNGGPRQAKAVMEGRRPPAAETDKYLSRVEEYMAQRTAEAGGRAVANDPDAIAAARVQQVRDAVDSWNLGRPEDVAAANEHLNAFLRASDQLGAGTRVDVTDIISPDTLSHAKVLDTMIDRMEGTRAGLLSEAGNAADAGEIRQVRQQLEDLQRNPPAVDDASIRAVAKEIQAQGAGRVSFKEALSQATEQVQGRAAEHAATMQRLQGAIERNRTAEQARQQIAALDEQITAAKAARAGVDAPGTAVRSAAMAARQALDEGAARALQEPAPAAVPETQTAKSATETPKSATQSPDVAASNAESATRSPESVKAAEAQAEQIAKLSPDMMVEIDGMEPMRVADLLEKVKQEVAQEKADAPLLQVAAECFLRSV